MRGVEGEQSNLVLVVQNQTAQDEILARIGSPPGNCSPGRGVGELECRDAKFAGILRIEIQIEMLQNKILLLFRRADEKADVRETEPVRKNREQRDPLVRPGYLRLQRGFGRIQNDPRRAHLGVFQDLGRAVLPPVEQAVIRPDIIDIDRLHDGGTDRNNAQISHDEAGENGAFERAINLQICPGRVTICQGTPDGKDDGPVKDQGDREQNEQSTPDQSGPSPTPLRECLAVFIHEGGNLFPRG